MSPRLHQFDEFATCVNALAELITGDLKQGIAEEGVATLALSGGSTPKALFEQLSHASIDWANVRITLVDDRCVEPEDQASNTRLVRETLLRWAASAAEFHPLHRPPLTGDILLGEASEMLRNQFSRYDHVLLGMGDDGHTASIFPGAAISEQALNPENPASVMLSEKAEAGYFRITQTLSQLLQADRISLLVKGPGKLDLLNEILQQGDNSPYPIARFLFQQQVPVDIYAAKQ